MANLNTNEKQILEKLFQMGGGYVLNFSDRTMGDFFKDDIGITIYQEQYHCASGSKANYMRGFWQNADNLLVAKSIRKLIEYIENQVLIGHLKQEEFSAPLITRAREIADRLDGKKVFVSGKTEDEFINQEFLNISLAKLGLDGSLTDLLEQRMQEINKSLKSKSSLAVIFLCGSTLEGILLGIASKNARDFNQSSISPKDNMGKVKQFQDWKLSNFIDVARDLNLLGEDVKKHSHSLRDFRNYIHPYEQLVAKFNPDEHTAKISWQVLQAAIFQLSK